MESPNYSDLEGEINVPQKSKTADDDSFDTLDEPVWRTIVKILQILYQINRKLKLKQFFVKFNSRNAI